LRIPEFEGTRPRCSPIDRNERAAAVFSVEELRREIVRGLSVLLYDDFSKEDHFVKRFSIFIYGVFCYAVSLVTFLYTAGFVGNFGVSRSLDAASDGSFATALLVNIALLSLFCVQHSVMARPAFKRWWTRFVAESAERSTYILFSSLALIVLFVYWQPMGGVVWNMSSPEGRIFLYVVYGLGWGVLLFSTFLINHFDLFGLRQIWLQLLGKPCKELPFTTPMLYRYVRHPIYVGWLMIFWAAPTMTIAHLVFAISTSVYILFAIQLEERDLVAAHPEYDKYRRGVPMLLPRAKRRAVSSASLNRLH
jgi:methanethiol S-methyltransferase